MVHAFNWKKLSLCAVLGYRWDGKRCRIWFQTRHRTYNDERLITFLRNLKKHLRGQRATLIWVGFPKIVETAELSGVSEAQASSYLLVMVAIRCAKIAPWAEGCAFMPKRHSKKCSYP
jgi:hypothetical protein